MYATDFLERAFLNVLRGNTLQAPGAVYIGLYLTSPGETGSGVELSYNGYERQRVQFSSASGNVIENTEQITFPQSEVTAGTATYFGISDSKIAGNMLAYGRLTEELEIMAGEAPVFMPKDIQLAVAGSLSVAYKNKLLDVFNGKNIEGITPHLALFSGDPDKSGGNELMGDNYERQEIVFSAPMDNSTGETTISNSNKIAFNRPTSNWGVWNHTVVMDSKRNGEAIWIYNRGLDKELKRGYMPIAEPGALKFSIH